MTFHIYALIAVTIILEIIGQIAFKIGLTGQDELPLWRRVVTSLPIMLGVLSYAVELVLWLIVLTVAPLSVAFPLAALAYCGTMFASRFILKEEISSQRWVGASIITLGVTLVCLSS